VQDVVRLLDVTIGPERRIVSEERYRQRAGARRFERRLENRARDQLVTGQPLAPLLLVPVIAIVVVDHGQGTVHSIGVDHGPLRARNRGENIRQLKVAELKTSLRDEDDAIERRWIGAESDRWIPWIRPAIERHAI